MQDGVCLIKLTESLSMQGENMYSVNIVDERHIYIFLVKLF